MKRKRKPLTCALPECIGRRAPPSDLCVAHYKRWTTEGWREVHLSLSREDRALLRAAFERSSPGESPPADLAEKAKLERERERAALRKAFAGLLGF